MTLYEIDKALEECFEGAVNEDGEIIDEDLFNKLGELQIARETKINNVLKYIKNIQADIEAEIKERDTFQAKIDANEKRIEGLKGFLNFALGGDKFKSDYGTIYYKPSQKTIIPENYDLSLLPEEYKTTKITVSPDKTKIKQAIIEQNMVFPGIEVEEKNTLCIRFPQPKKDDKDKKNEG